MYTGMTVTGSGAGDANNKNSVVVGYVTCPGLSTAYIACAGGSMDGGTAAVTCIR
jgi:hypothetical protein